MTDNIAVLEGFVEEIEGEYNGTQLNLLIKPDTDVDGRFKAWDMNMQEFIFVNGWLTVFEAVK